mmetsp:Transcript_95398/g.270028  ORF Transcript_95398/g.270028 Transcript_95398/m.270028 type:complete len:470 (+) Transcript_95398:2052-3461(+)
MGVACPPRVRLAVAEQVRGHLPLALHLDLPPGPRVDPVGELCLRLLAELDFTWEALLHHTCCRVDRVAEEAEARQLLPDDTRDHRPRVDPHLEYDLLAAVRVCTRARPMAGLECQNLLGRPNEAPKNSLVAMFYVLPLVFRHDADCADVLLTDSLDLCHPVPRADVVEVREVLVEEREEVAGGEPAGGVVEVHEHDEEDRHPLHLVRDHPARVLQHRDDDVLRDHVLQDVVHLLAGLPELHIVYELGPLALVQVQLLDNGNEARREDEHHVGYPREHAVAAPVHHHRRPAVDEADPGHGEEHVESVRDDPREEEDPGDHHLRQRLPVQVAVEVYVLLVAVAAVDVLELLARQGEGREAEDQQDDGVERHDEDVQVEPLPGPAGEHRLQYVGQDAGGRDQEAVLDEEEERLLRLELVQVVDVERAPDDQDAHVHEDQGPRAEGYVGALALLLPPPLYLRVEDHVRPIVAV